MVHWDVADTVREATFSMYCLVPACCLVTEVPLLDPTEACSFIGPPGRLVPHADRPRKGQNNEEGVPNSHSCASGSAQYLPSYLQGRSPAHARQRQGSLRPLGVGLRAKAFSSQEQSLLCVVYPFVC